MSKLIIELTDDQQKKIREKLKLPETRDVKWLGIELDNTAMGRLAKADPNNYVTLYGIAIDPRESGPGPVYLIGN